MIQIKVLQDSEGNFKRIEADGHAGYACSGGDIICAAVSALMINTANSVETFTKDSFQAELEEESGHFSLRFSSDMSKESQLLLKSLVLGLQNISSEYGARYIQIQFKEV